MSWSTSITRPVVGALVAILLGGCGASPAPSSAPPASEDAPTAATATPAPTGPTPVIVDTDMSADDIMALLYLLRDPAVDVRAIVASGTGLAHSSNGAQLASDLLGVLGSDIPLGIGDNAPMDGGRAFPDAWRQAPDAGFGLALSPVPMGPSPAVDLLSSTIRSSATPVTILTLGPLTDLGQALSADPSLAANIARIQVSGGAIDVPGNVAFEGGDPAAAAAEWNLWIDPTADDIVLRSGIPVTLVPLDATGKLPLTPAFLDALAADHAAAGADIVYELLVRNGSLLAGTFFWDQLAAVLLADPAAASLAEAQVKVVTDGAASGSLSRDASGTPVSYATAPDAASFQATFLAGLRRGAPRRNPFTLTGTLHATFDGSTCAGTPSTPVASGTYGFDDESSVAQLTVFALIRLHEGATWKQLVDHTATVGPDNPDMSPPDYVDAVAVLEQDGPGTASAVVSLTPGTYGIVCLMPGPASITPAATTFQVGG